MPQEALYYYLKSLLNLAEDVKLVQQSITKFRKQAAGRNTYYRFSRPTPLKKDNLILIIYRTGDVDT